MTKTPDKDCPGFIRCREPHCSPWRCRDERLLKNTTTTSSPEPTMTVNLSLHLNKEVRVTFRNGAVETGIIVKNNKGSFEHSHPFMWNRTSRTYSKNGFCSTDPTRIRMDDIIKIELVEKPKYQQLEEQIAAMQKEVERLKKEEQNTLAEYSGFKITKSDKGYVDLVDSCGATIHTSFPLDIMRELAKQMAS